MNHYIHPELSLLSFNERVLNNALEPSIPLLERLKFLCIFSSNMDEYFEIRISGLKAKSDSGYDVAGPDGLTPISALEQISNKAHQLVDLQYSILNEQLLPELDQQGISFLRPDDWNKEQSNWLKSYFKKEVLPILTPIRLDPAHPFPLTINKGLAMVVDLHDPDRDEAHNIAVVPVPRALPRFIQLPDELSNSEYSFVYMSAIISAHIKKLFSGTKVTGCHQFRITRNSDLYVDLEEVEDLARTLEGELPSRLYGEAIRLEVGHNCPKRIVKFLQDRFHLDEKYVYRVDGPVNLNRLLSLPDLINRAGLKYTGFKPSVPEYLGQQHNIFDTIANGDVLLHHPFESFVPVMELLRQAALDPEVLVIKQTLYRVGSDSAMIDHLADAARAGKEVTVIIELMARFDEKNNLSVAQKLQRAGAHVVYGLVGKKTHAKMLMIVRREAGKLKRYAHLGTGNYHQGNTRVYTDYGYLTAKPELTTDVHEIFMQLTSQGSNPDLEHLSQSPGGIREMVIEKINREAEIAQAGGEAKIIFKVNGLSSQSVIDALYEASAKGVKIILIVRGICCLRAGLPELSENIEVRSVVGRFLEHNRVYYFHNEGKEDVYISSADLMPRNLVNRIETCTPIYDASSKERIIENLELYASDNQNAWIMQQDGSYVSARKSIDDQHTPVAAQQILLSQYSEAE
jgi:polyphosphate kinase